MATNYAINNLVEEKFEERKKAIESKKIGDFYKANYKPVRVDCRTIIFVKNETGKRETGKEKFDTKQNKKTAS